MDGQKRVYFRAVEYKATSSKNSKERKDQGHPTQPIAPGVTNTEPTGTSITKFAGFTYGGNRKYSNAIAKPKY
jgi:hypothetical protein